MKCMVFLTFPSIYPVRVVCGCLYRHPNSDIDEFMKYIAICLTKVNKEKKDCFYLVISTLISLNTTLITNMQSFSIQ